MTIPEGVSDTDFAAALEGFERAVGREWLFTSDEDVALYRDAYSPFYGEPEEPVASAAVAPDTVEQVQEVVRVANRYRIPIYPISTGKNLGYGGAAPGYSGSVVLDLKRMNRVINVDERNHSVLVEPGVSYFDLYNYIQEHGHRVWIDCPDPGWGSLIGNALEHGVGHTRPEFRDHFDAHCGMEVVLPDGELMRTGMGAVPNAGSWQGYKYGFGPQFDGLFSQGNFGVVTKMGFWLMPEPEAYRSGRVSVFGYRDLIALVDTMNHATNSGLSNGFPGLQSPLYNAFGNPQRTEFLMTRPSPDAVERYARENDVPVWSCKLGFLGPEKVIAAQWEATRQLFAKALPDARFADGEVFRFPLSPEQTAKVQTPGYPEKVEFGIPNLSRFGYVARSEMNPNPADGELWFSPIIPKTGEAIFKAQEVFRTALDEWGNPEAALGFFSLPLQYFPRSFLLLFALRVTRSPEQNRQSRELFSRLVALAAENGWAEYRAPAAMMDEVANAYSFNNHALRRFQEKLKDAADPNGIMSPGRGGVWPRHLRETRA